MHKLVIVGSLSLASSLLQACRRQPTADELSNDAAYDQNEDDALNQIRENSQETAGAEEAMSGMMPDQNGNLPMANVQ